MPVCALWRRFTAPHTFINPLLILAMVECVILYIMEISTKDERFAVQDKDPSCLDMTRNVLYQPNTEVGLTYSQTSL